MGTSFAAFTQRQRKRLDMVQAGLSYLDAATPPSGLPPPRRSACEGRAGWSTLTAAPESSCSRVHPPAGQRRCTQPTARVPG
jgi:hypothetical protein